MTRQADRGEPPDGAGAHNCDRRAGSRSRQFLETVERINFVVLED
jgi:hypothetical protein